jgi:conjugal transfer/type IV secretion protein DotA/TraY
MDMSQDQIFATSTADSSSAIASIHYGKTADASFCGGVVVDATRITDSTFGSRSSSSAVGYRVASVNYDWIADQMQSRAKSNFPNFVSQISTLSRQWYDQYVAFNTNGGPRPVVPLLQLEGLAANYYQNMQPAQNDAQQQSQALSATALEAMKKFGWFGAGAWYATLAEVNAAMAQAAQTVSFRSLPILVDAKEGGNNSKLNAALEALNSGAGTDLRAPENVQAKGNQSSWQALCTVMTSWMAQSSVQNTGNCSFGQTFAMGLIDMSTAGSGGASSSSNSGLRLIDPVIAMKNMGDYLMVTSESLFAIYSYVKSDGDDKGLVSSVKKGIGDVVMSALDKIPLVGGVVEAFKSIMAILPMLMGAMFILGAVMSLWLPMVPFVNWWGGLVQYLTIFFEGVAAGPIWAFVHLDANGEGMGQRTETGYLFIINMLFRPFLMLLGFVAAAALMIVMGSFLFWLYPSVMANVQGNSVTGVASVVGFLFIFWILMHTLVTTLSNMSVLLPDQALAWAGKAIGATLGRDADQQTRGTFMAFGRFGQQGMADVGRTAAASRKAAAGGRAASGGGGGAE